jgi:hypothetical protein
MEGYANPTVLNGTAGNSAPVGGRRHRKVSAKTIRKTLKHLGLKPKGRVVLKAGGEGDMGEKPPMGGRRKSRRTRRKGGLGKLFGY